MILNQTTINNAIAKAKCCLANKTINYFDKLSIGIDKDCLFKESIVLKGYIDTLSNFQIVGSKTTCDCCIGGNYTFNLGGVNSESQIQFNCNNEGWIVSNNTNYPFTYIYDSYNNLLNIQLTKDFPNLIVNGTFNTDTNGWTISFTDDWIWSSYNGGSMLYNGKDAGGFASQDILTVGETYSVEFDIYLENQDYEGKADLVVNLGTNSLVVFPFAAITTTKTIHIKTTLVCLGNSTFSFSISHTNDDGYKNFYIDNVVVKKLSLYTLNTNFNDNCDIIVTGSNQMVLSSSSIQIEDIPDENTSCTINILNLDFEVIHTLEIPFNVLEQPDEVVDYWNENSNTNFILTYSDDIYIMYSDMFGNYIDYTFEIEYTTSEEEETQDAVFEEYSSSYNLKTEDPCESKIISQTCLTNKQVISIIQHINKICKNC